MREEIRESFSHIRRLKRDIENRFPEDSVKDQVLRNEIAGMFAVAIVATYEGLIREILIFYASAYHAKYKDHVERDLEKMNSRITERDLFQYAQLFGLPASKSTRKKGATIFHDNLAKQKEIVARRFRSELMTNYENLFKWRNSYAHSRSSPATIGEVYNAHRVAQYVVTAFAKSFEP